MYVHLADPKRTLTWMRRFRRQSSYTPHSAYQAEVHLNKSPIKILQCGRRSGKTVAAAGEILIRGGAAARTPMPRPGVGYKESYREDELADMRPGVLIQIISPTRALADGAMDILEWVIPDSWKTRNGKNQTHWETDISVVDGTVGKDKRMVMPLDMGGSYFRPRDAGIYRQAWIIEVVSAKAIGAGQGKGVDVMVFTEAHETPDEVWRRTQAQAHDPTRLNRVLVESIPSENSQHWTARLWRETLQDRTGLRSGFRWTCWENPLNSPQLLERIVSSRGREMPEDRWLREYMAHRPAGVGGYFTYLDSVIASVKPPRGRESGREYVAGLDHGLSENTVMVVKDRSTGMTVDGRSFPASSTLGGVVRRVRDMSAKWGVSRLVIDGTGPAGDQMYDQLKEGLRGLQFTLGSEPMNGPDKARLYEQYKLGIEHGAVRIPERYVELREQLAAIKVKAGQTRYAQFESEGSYRKDWVDAEVLAFSAMRWDARSLTRSMSVGDLKAAMPPVREKTWWDEDGYESDAPPMPVLPEEEEWREGLRRQSEAWQHMIRTESL